MARAGILFSQVVKAATQLAAAGTNPTVDTVRAALGDTGSKGTIAPMLKQWKAQHQGETAAAGAGLPAVRRTDAAAHGQERRVLVLLALPGLQGHVADRVPDGPAQRTAQAARCLQGVLILAFPLPRRPLHWRRGKRPAPRGTPKRASPSATVCASCRPITACWARRSFLPGSRSPRFP